MLRLLGRQIHRILTEIMNKTYPDKNIPSFWIEVNAKEMATFHGDYYPLKRKIRIFNLSRETTHIITTSIHELAHHVDCCLNGTSGHNKRFYGIYKELLETAIKMGIINYDVVRSVTDAADIRSLEKYYGQLTVTYNQDLDTNKDIRIIKVFNSFAIKDKLKNRGGYSWNSVEQAWCKEISLAELAEENLFLLSLTSEENIKIQSLHDLKIEAVYYIVVKGGYEQRNILKQNDYKFNGYGYKGNVWVKKIKANDFQMEKNFLDAIRDIKYKVENK